MTRRFNPWHYPRKSLPHRKTLADWRARGRALADKLGARTSCDICKRPVNVWGGLFMKHPFSKGKSRKRRMCKSCAELIMLLVDVLEWKGASEHLPPEEFSKLKGTNHRRPEDVPDSELLLTEPMRGDGGSV